MTVVRDQLFPQKPPGSRFRFSRTGVQPSPGSSTIELPSAFADMTGHWNGTVDDTASYLLLTLQLTSELVCNNGFRFDNEDELNNAI